MANPFLEERLSVSIRYGSTYSDDFNVEITQVSGGAEYRRLVNPFPCRIFNIGYVTTTTDIGARVLDLYYRAFGRYAGFRVKNLDDYTTNGYTDSPTAYDQTLELVSTGVYQLQKKYGTGGSSLSIGYPIRTIFKPVASTTLVAIVNTSSGNHAQTVTTHWTVSTTTGLVTFAANKTDLIEGITLGATTTIALTGHAYNVGDSVHFSGIVGTTQLNGYRSTISAKTTDSITIPINSSAYTSWVSGGTVNTQPQTGETVKGGCEFDTPCRFNTRVEIEMTEKGIRSANSIELVELLTL